MSDEKQTPKQIAELIKQFIESPIGKLYVRQLSDRYNALHQQAESPQLTLEQKALSIQEAVGVKFAIHWLTDRQALLDRGYFPEETPAKKK